MSADFTIESLELEELFTEVNAVDVYQVNSERSQFLHAFEGKMSVAEEQFTIQLALPSLFPLKKPMYFLKNCQEAGFIPHIEPDGFICYSHDEGLLLDRNNPKGIIHESFQRAKRTLEEGVLKLNSEDFLLEFEALWSRQQGIGHVDAIITPEERFKKILVFNDEKRGKSIILDSINKRIVQYMNNLYSSNNVLDEFNKRNGIYIPLRRSSNLKPPAFWETWDIRDYRQLINNNITASTKKKLKKYLDRKFIQKGDEEYIVLGIPILNGQRALIGIKLSDFRTEKGKGKNFPFLHPLRKNQAAFEITPLNIKRHDKEYLLNRTQGHNRFSDKRVTIVGLGSLGSRICFELARAGVEKFILIDNDVLEADNIYRHELGIRDVYYKETEKYYHFPKTEAMKRAMKNKFPSIEIEYESSDILDVINEEPGLMLVSDLVIIALGAPTEELYINEKMRKMNGAPPTLFTWLDPLGLGGHALLTRKEATGCFQCLFTQPDTPSRLIANQASFAAPGQNFRKSIAGCQSVFTPYGSIDALETAVMATRLALRVLAGEEKGSPLMSWKGDSTELLSQGYQLSERYGFSSEVLFDTRYLYKNENCAICQAGETP
ncbi:ThiF family adenylyltransferase [Alkalihalobacillus oceani]|uniref:ThiF family adenylyltransferase n=1 Tax=Halalkalibacter oceani TaxID=1653776 RepID=A0A9X2DUH5_9BACI|nr:E2/UBC family protein [Halalkalibacter oceani]MCM3716628.1 ThiF family adenylyltransferase [Halalkalibacter oceani]